MTRSSRKNTSLIAICAAALCVALPAHAANKAVILTYHHVATDTPGVTSVTPREFERHLDYLDSNDFNVWRLSRVLESLRDGSEIPDKTVSFTFDDAYESVFTNARRALRKREWPFAVFVASAAIDEGHAPYMTWDQLATLVREGHEIGNHGASHAHPHALSHAEFRADILQAQERIVAETGHTPLAYAYPYGEFDRELESIVADVGLVGLGQQSGVAAPGNLTHVPRFPISSRYADQDAFALRVNAHPLPMEILAPESRLLRSGARMPRLVFRTTQSFSPRVNCFTNTGVSLATQRVDDTTIAIEATGSVPAGRSKYTCTAPTDAGGYAWYSHLWIAR